MSSTNITQHPENVGIGPASLCLMDELNDRLVIIGKVDEIVFEKLDPADEFMSEVVDAQRVEVAGQPTFCGYQVRGKLAETLDPNTQYMVMKDCGVPAITSQCTLATAVERYTVFHDRCIKLKHNAGFYGEQALPAPKSATISKIEGIGSVPGGIYVFVVTCVYGTTEGDHVESNSLNIGATAVYCKVEPPEGGDVPDAYRIYVYNTEIGETRDDATLLLETDAAQVVFEDIDRGGALYPGDAEGSFSVTDTAGNPFEAGVDYTLDASCALVCVEETGEIGEGETVTVTYTYRRNPYSTMSIGPRNRIPPYAHVVLLALRDDDRAVIRPRGVEIHLWKVLASAPWTWDLSALNFQSGFEFAWRVLLSEKTLNHGQVQSFNRHLENYDLADWLAMTDWSTAPGCEGES